MKKIILSLCILLVAAFTAYAQKDKTNTSDEDVRTTLGFKLKNAKFIYDSVARPKTYVDGKLFEFDLNLINQNMIESVSVIKGEEAKKDYNAPQGVILIKTKIQADTSGAVLRIRQKNSKLQEKLDPLFIIDGKVSDKTKVKALTPIDIDDITVIKGEEATKKYNAPNGVIIIKTKTEK